MPAHRKHEPTRERVAANFRRLLSRTHVAKMTLGREASVPRSVIDRIEDADTGATIDTLGRLADALGVDIREFFVAVDPSVLTGGRNS